MQNRKIFEIRNKDSKNFIQKMFMIKKQRNVRINLLKKATYFR